MKQTDERYQQYIKVLKEELVAAMGCTEPVSIAYAAARARELLGAEPRHVLIEASGNIIKNVKSVTVPHTGGMKGIEAAAAAGIAAGDASRGLQVIASIAESSLPQIKAYLERTDIQVRRLESADVLDLIVRVRHGEEEAAVRISGAHDHIVWEMKNGDVLLRRKKPRQEEAPLIDRSFMSVEGILDFADSVDLDEVSDVLQRQIRCNMAIANEGLKQGYGANIGRVLLDMRGEGQGLCGRRQRCAHERLRPAGHHQFRQRQSRHHRIGSPRRLGKGASGRTGTAVSLADRVQPDHGPSQERHRQAERLLRRHQRGLRRRLRHLLSGWRRP